MSATSPNSETPGPDVTNGSVNADDPKEEEEPFVWNRRVYAILIILSLAAVCQGACYSLLAPFFPHEAELKQNSATDFGIIFGAYQLVVFITSPINGKLLSTTIRPKVMLCTGMFVDGICCCLFGTLKYSPPGSTFFALALAVRIMESIGASFAFTCYYTIIGAEFPNKVGVFIPLIETIFGIGLMIGPSIGGFLYGLGGYVTPFAVMGILLTTLAVTSMVVFPEIERPFEESPFGMKDLLKEYRIMVDMLLIVTCFIAVGFNEATLAVHTEQFKLTSAINGLIFIVSGGVHSVASIIWGGLCSKMVDTRYLCVIGCISTIICFIFIGPLPFLKLPTTLWLVIVTQVFLGLGMGAKFVCGFMHALKFVMDVKGFPNSLSTYALMSGMFSSAFSLGSFIGPVVGGVLLDHVGYEWGTIYMVGMDVIMVVIMIIVIMYDRIIAKPFQKAAKDEERQPILQKSHDDGRNGQ